MDLKLLTIWASNDMHTTMQMEGVLKAFPLSAALRGSESSAMQIGGVYLLWWLGF